MHSNNLHLGKENPIGTQFLPANPLLLRLTMEWWCTGEDRVSLGLNLIFSPVSTPPSTTWSIMSWRSTTMRPCHTSKLRERALKIRRRRARASWVEEPSQAIISPKVEKCHANFKVRIACNETMRLRNPARKNSRGLFDHFFKRRRQTEIHLFSKFNRGFENSREKSVSLDPWVHQHHLPLILLQVLTVPPIAS